MRTAICVIGLKGAGKDTLCDVAQELYPNFCRVSMSEAIRRVVWHLLDYKIKDRDCLWGDKDKKESVIDPEWIMPPCVVRSMGLEKAEPWTGRRLMQYYGTECGREIEDSIWLNAVTKLVAEMPDNAIFLVSDARFENEVENFRSMGCKVHTLKVVRTEVVLNEFSDHASEQYAKDAVCDNTIENNGTLEELKASVASYLDKVIQQQ